MMFFMKQRLLMDPHSRQMRIFMNDLLKYYLEKKIPIGKIGKKVM